MIVFPNAKINLGLHVTEKRSDGYHNIESLFYPIGLSDILEIIPSGEESLAFTQSGIGLPAKQGDNLVEKAYDIMKGKVSMPKLKVHLHKAIPFGAGLGGGSSDASFALKCLNDMSGKTLSNDELQTLSANVGADCPFFVTNTPCLVSGIGDILEPIDFSLAGYYFVLVKPNVEVPTPQAYKYVVPRKPELRISEIIRRPVEEWKNLLVNDFESSVFKSFPEIAEVKEQMYKLGAVYASMSGSGASVFGLFKTELDATKAFPKAFVYHQLLE